MRKSMLLGVIGVCAVFLAIGVLWAVQDPLTIQSKYGNVSFSHQKHSGQKCQECHHTTKEGDQNPQPCTECHKEGAKVAAKEAFHKKCVECHKKAEKGPAKCKECHQKA